MKKINNRQYKLTQIKPKRFSKANIKTKKGKCYDSRLDRRK